MQYLGVESQCIDPFTTMKTKRLQEILIARQLNFCSFFSPFKSGMEEVIVDEVRQFTSLLSQLTGQPINMASQFNLPILNALWRITVGDRFEYTDPQLLDLIRRMGLFFQKLASPATLIALTQPWIFKVGFLTILFIK